MADEPTAGEAIRALDRFRQDTQRDLGDMRRDIQRLDGEMRAGDREISARLDGFVPLAAYRADRAADEKQDKTQEKNRRFWIGAVIIPSVPGLIALWIYLRGGK